MLPKHWWEGTDSQGRKRDISATTLETPLGSGPYRIKEFVAGRSVALERVKDYWGAKLRRRSARIISTSCVSSSFATIWSRSRPSRPIRPTGSRENSAKHWATAYDFPAVAEKRVVKEEFPDQRSGRMQAFVLNLRRDQFKDARVRRAFNYAFDFEEMNKQLFYRPVQAHQQLFRRHGAGVVRTAGRAGIGNSRDGARQGAGRGLHDALHQSGRRQSGSGSRQSARGAALLKEAGLRGPRTQARRPQPASRSRVEIWCRIRPPSGSRCSSSHRWSGSASRVDPRRRRCAIREPAPQLRFRHDHRPVGGVAVARQRAARVLGFAGGGPAGLAKHRSASRTRRSTR